MKKTIYVVEQETNGDNFVSRFDDYEAAKKEVEMSWDGKGTTNVWLITYGVEVPENYEYVNAEKLYDDLFDEEITTSDFDLQLGNWVQDAQIDAADVPNTNKMYLKDKSGRIIESVATEYISSAYIHNDWEAYNEGVAIVNAWGKEEYHRVWHDGEPDLNKVDEGEILKYRDGYYGEWEATY